MSEPEYDRERAAIRDTYGDSRNEASIRWEQALALLFYRSNWTQEQLAAKEGKSKGDIDRRLRFGRFLAISTNPPDRCNLTEWAFRRLWNQTDTNESELAHCDRDAIIRKRDTAGAEMDQLIQCVSAPDPWQPADRA